MPAQVAGAGNIVRPTSIPFVDARYLLGDVDGDGLADLNAGHRGNPDERWTSNRDGTSE